jgi:hypothetical protein
MIDKEANIAYFFVVKDGKKFLVQNFEGETSVSPADLSWTNRAYQKRRDFYRWLKEHTIFQENPNRKRLLTKENLWGVLRKKTWWEIPCILTWNE